MKKIISIILATIIIFSLSICVSAQTLESDEWGIKFDLSNNWNRDYSETDNITYTHKQDSQEWLCLYYLNDTLLTTRGAQSNFDELLDNFFSTAAIKKNIAEASNVPEYKISVTEKYQNRRYETYNGYEYYRGEKQYLIGAMTYGNTKYNATYFYETYFFTIQNGKAFIIEYSSKGSTAPHFSDITAMLNSMRFTNQDGSFYRIGDTVGHALKTDIKATINGHQIPSFNVDGYTYIVAEDLRYYGFSVNFDNTTRSLSVTRDYSQTWVSKNYTKPYVSPSQVGQKEHALLYTDIKTYLDGYYTPSYNINGQTIIRFDSLFGYGVGSYDNSRRETFLLISGIN